MKKVISLLLALVMTLSLCSSVWATDTSQEDDKGAQEEEYTMDTLLAEVDKVEGVTGEAKAAAKKFLADNFIYDGRFVVLKGISFWNNRFYETNSNKEKAKTVLDSYTEHKAVLGSVPVKYGAAYNMTVDSLMNMYRAAQECPVIQEGMPFPEGGPTTGEVVGVENLKITEKNKGYIEAQDVTAAKDFFNNHFRYVDLGEEYSGDHAVDFKAEFYDGDGKLIGDKVRSVIDEYNNDLRAGSVVLLNELNIHMPNRDGTECYHFWRLMDMYKRQLNGGDQGGDDRPTTGDVTNLNNLRGEYAEAARKLLSENGIKYEDLQVWVEGAEFNSTGNGYANEESCEKVRKAFSEYYKAREGIKETLNQLKVSDGPRFLFFSERMYALYQLTLPKTGDKAPADLTDEGAKAYLGQYIDYNNGRISIKGTGIQDGMFTDPQVAEAALEAFDIIFDRAVTDTDSEATLDALNSLRVYDSDGNERMFQDLMRFVFRDILAGSSEEATDAALRRAGFAVPAADMLEVTFPEALKADVDYTWDYNVENGVLTVMVKAGSKDHWLQAAMETSPGLEDGVYYRIAFKNPGKSFTECTTGNGSGGIWTRYINGDVRLHSIDVNETIGNSQPIAAVNRDADSIVVTPNDVYSGNRVVVAWDDADTITDNAVKYMIKLVTKIEPFNHETKLDGTDKVKASRIKTSVDADNNWTVTREDGKVTVRAAANSIQNILGSAANYENGQFGTITVEVPKTGYTLDVSSCFVESEWNIRSDCTGTFPLYVSADNNNGQWTFSGSDVYYTLVWRNGTDSIRETLIVSVADNGSAIKNLGKYDKDGQLTSSEVPVKTADTVSVTNTGAAGISATFDVNTGFFHTTFDNTKLPAAAELGRSGILLVPDGTVSQENLNKVVKYRVQEGDGNWDFANLTVSEVEDMAKDFANSDVYPMSDTNRRTIPYVATTSVYLEKDSVEVFFAFTQQYRWKVVQWLDEEGNVLGYTYIYGKNDAFVNSTTTKSVNKIENVQENDKPYVISDTEFDFICKRYPVEGENKHCWYFRLMVDGAGDHQGPYGVYLPYEYFGLTYEQAKELKNPPMINHYEEGDGSQPVSIVGKYTEYGIYFETPGFSPFTVTCDPTTQSQTTPPRYYYNSTTAADGKQEGGNSPTTFDAGIALYVGMALTSAAGMAWVGKKRR